MDGEGQERIVYFDKYCPSCAHYDKSGDEEPCYSCMDEGYNVDSHKPVKYKKDPKKAGADIRVKPPRRLGRR